MTRPINHLYQDPEYVQGQIASLQSLILGLAEALLSPEEFRERSSERLEMLKTAMLSEPVSDSRLYAVNDCLKWVHKATEQNRS